MLRAFLCLDALLAQTAVAAVLLAAFLIPLGAGIAAWVHWFPWWGPSMLPLALLALVLLWVALSHLGAMPRAWRPWARSPRTIWLDKCCIDQSSPEMIAAGTSSFGIFLADCDNMVAFASSTYFSRLWWAAKPCLQAAPLAPHRLPTPVSRHSTQMMRPESPWHRPRQVRVRARHLLPYAQGQSGQPTALAVADVAERFQPIQVGAALRAGCSTI